MISDVSFDAQTEVSFDLFAVNNKQYDNSFAQDGEDGEMNPRGKPYGNKLALPKGRIPNSKPLYGNETPQSSAMSPGIQQRDTFKN